MAGTRWDPNAVFKDLTLIVEDTLAINRPNLYPLICARKDAGGAYTRVPIADNVAMPRIFEGERSVQSKDITVLQTYTQQTYELTIDLDVDLLNDAKAYDQSDIVREASISAVQFPDYMTSQLVINGATNLAYDGNAFYGGTHKYANAGANNIVNTVTRTGTSIAALATDLGTAIAQLKTFKDSKGRLLNQQARLTNSDIVIHCPAAMEANFRQLLHSGFIPVKADVVTSGTAAVMADNNIWQGQAELFVDAYLDGDDVDDWYVHYVSRPQRPFVFLEDYPMEMKVLGPDSEFCTNFNKCRIALKHRFVLGYYRFDRSIKVAA